MFKLKHIHGKENIRGQQTHPELYKPHSPTPLIAPSSPFHHTFAKVKRNQHDTSPIRQQSRPPPQEIDLECDEKLEAIDHGEGLRAMAEQIQMDLRCDEELDEPCSKCTHYEALMARVKVVLEAYHRRTADLELQLQKAKGEGWDRDRYYRQ